MSSYDFKNAVAVVTGAGSGIGRALAIGLAARGTHVAISDINQDALQETLAMLDAFDVKTRADFLDVTNQDDVFRYANTIQDHFGSVNLVFNNAGAALNGEFSRVNLDNFAWQMDVNFWGVAYGTKAFLPVLEQSEWGHITNISSLFGLVSSPGNSAYNASKFAVRGMTEALRIELDLAKSSVSCSCVHPGGIKTNIVRNARPGRGNTFIGGKTRDEMVAGFDQVAHVTPERAAEVILRGTQKNKKRILIGKDAWIIDKIQRLLPTRYFEIMRGVFGFGKGLVD